MRHLVFRDSTHKEVMVGVSLGIVGGTPGSRDRRHEERRHQGTSDTDKS